MNLIFHSGGDGIDNRRLAKEMAAMLHHKARPLITFVPAHGDDAKAEYRSFVRTFTALGLKDFQCIPVDRNLTPESKAMLFTSDAIFLGGGNTYYFLKSLRESGLLPGLRKYVKAGGVLLGLSAGSILMTPSIRTASVPSLDQDDNDVRIKDLRALGLVPFEFSPHYHPNKEVDEELREYSKSVPYPVYACADGQGIIVRDGKIHFIGAVKVFHRGRKHSKAQQLLSAQQ